MDEVPLPRRLWDRRGGLFQFGLTHLAHALTVFGLTLGPEQPTQLRRQLSGLFGQSPSRPALNLPVAQLRLEFGIRDHPVAGDLLEAKV